MQLYCWNKSICNLTLRECLKRVLVVNFRKLTTHILRKKQGSFLSYRSQNPSACAQLYCLIIFAFFSASESCYTGNAEKSQNFICNLHRPTFVLEFTLGSIYQALNPSIHSLQLAPSHSFQNLQIFFPAGKLWYFRESQFFVALRTHVSR